MLARDYYLSLIQAFISFPFTVEVRLVFDEVTEHECHIHGSVRLERSAILFVSEYCNLQNALEPVKYRYHLQTEAGEFLSRWDNAPHHPRIATHPHHLHLNDGRVLASEIHDLFTLIKVLSAYLPA